MNYTEEVKKAYILRDMMDRPGRNYQYSEKIKESSGKRYQYKETNATLAKIARDEVALVADCFIMYAVALHTFCTVTTVYAHLKVMRTRYSSLSLPSCDSLDLLESRMRELVNSGLLFRTYYDLEDESGKKNIALYSVVEDACTIVSHKLDKRVICNKWIQTCPLYHSIGIASSGYTALQLRKDKNYVADESGVVRFVKSGTTFLPSELKYEKDGTLYYVACHYGYLHHDTTISTDDDYSYNLARRLILLEEYLKYRTRKGIAMVIITVENNEDLLKYAEKLINSDVLDDSLLERLFFTSEGIMQSYAMKDANVLSDYFISIRRSAEGGYDFISSKPPFLS